MSTCCLQDQSSRGWSPEYDTVLLSRKAMGPFVENVVAFRCLSSRMVPLMTSILLHPLRSNVNNKGRIVILECSCRTYR